MSMHQGMDLSKFKRIATSKESSTLRHSKGHEIKIAHSAMSPKMREQIEKLPLYLAEGTPDGPIETPEAEPDEPAPAEESAPEAPAEEPEAEPAAPAEKEMAPPESPKETPPRPAADAVVPQNNTFDVLGNRKVPTAQELDNEDALFAQDLQRGHIKPETMADLFGKKDTVGKIGTIFGLLIGGAGAGLSGQPNALLGMMQKEIDNDLAAQQHSNENAQNWLRMSQQHEMQKAQIGRMKTENRLTETQIGKAPSEIALNKAHTASAKADADLKATQNAKTKMQMSLYQQLQDQVNKMPPGPSKDAATNLLTNTLGPGIQNNIKQTNAATADQLQARAKLRGESPENDPGVDFNRLNTLASQGQAAEIAQFPIMPGKGMTSAQAAAANQEASKVMMNHALMNNWKKGFEELDNMNRLIGKINPEAYNAIVAPITGQLAQTMPQAEAENMAHALFPDPKDWGKARQEKIRFGYDHFKTMEAGTPTLQNFGLKTPFPDAPVLKGDKKAGTVASVDKAKTAPKKDEGEIVMRYGAKYRKVKGGLQKVK